MLKRVFSAIWRLPIFRDDLGLFFGGKDAGRILKLLVREIELSEHVETRRRLRRVRFDDVQFDVVDVVQIGPFPPLPESPGHVQGHPQGGFVRHSLLFAGWAAFPGTPRKRSYKFLRRITYLCQFGATVAHSIGLNAETCFPSRPYQKMFVEPR